jgi:hypothetical protein
MPMKITALLYAAALATGAGIVGFASGAESLQFDAVPKPAAGRSANPARALPPGELLAELRKGGYVVYFRHTATDFSRDDARSGSEDDCDNQRPLTDQGRADAREIGAALRELQIPIARVLASPRCRTMETAMLAFGKAEKSAAARSSPATPGSDDRYAALRALLSTPPKSGGNVVIASHGNPFYAVAGAPYLAEGEAAVIRPLGKDFEITARVRHDGWRALQRMPK